MMNVQKEVIDFLTQMAKAPKDIRRYSTSAWAIFYVTKEELLFPSYMLQDFIAIVSKKDRFNSRQCINSSVDQNATHRSLRFFLRAHCHKTDPVLLAGLILNAAIEFIQKHPGSIFHLFMMLRQLRNTFKFGESTDYNSRLIALEQKALKQVLYLQNLLEPSNDFSQNVQQAINVISDDTKITLAQRKIALLTLACHHISADSMDGCQLNVMFYNRKNFQLVLTLSELQTFSPDVCPISDLSLRQRDESHLSMLSQDPNLDTMKLSLDGSTEYTVVQHKQLYPYWVNFLCKLNADYSNENFDFLDIMTRALMDFCESNPSDIAKENLKIWCSLVNASASPLDSVRIQLFPEVEETVQEEKPPVEEEEQKQETQVQQEQEQAKQEQEEPEQEVQQEQAAKESLSSASEMPKAINPRRENSPVQSGFAPSTLLSPIVEEDVHQRSPSPSASAINHDDQDEDDNDASVNNFVNPFADSILFIAKSSGFANQFIENIRACYSQGDNVTQTSKQEALEQLIKNTLDLAKRAIDCQLIVLAKDEIQFLRSAHVATIHLKATYPYLWMTLESIVCAKWVKKKGMSTEQKNDALSCYQDAGATLILLRHHLYNHPFEAHESILTEKSTMFSHSLLDMLVYREEPRVAYSDREKGTAQNELAKKPELWQKYYNTRVHPTEETLRKRRYLESGCAHLLANIIKKQSDTHLSLEESALVLFACQSYMNIQRLPAVSQVGNESPFYHGLRLLVATDAGFHEQPLALWHFSDNQNQIRAEQLVIKLLNAASLLQVETKSLTPQQAVLYKKAFKILHAMVGSSYVADDGEADNDELNSVSDAMTSSHVGETVRRRIGSHYTVSNSSRSGSQFSGSSNASQQLLAKQVSNQIIEQFFCSNDIAISFGDREAKLVLKSFVSFYRKEVPESHQNSLSAINKVFDYLFSLFSLLLRRDSKKRFQVKVTETEFISAENRSWMNLIGYVESACKQGQCELFALYCLHASRQEDPLLTHEIECIMRNMKYLYLHQLRIRRDIAEKLSESSPVLPSEPVLSMQALQIHNQGHQQAACSELDRDVARMSEEQMLLQQAFDAAIELTEKTWDALLKKLEKNRNVPGNSDAITVYKKMLLDDKLDANGQSRFIEFPESSKMNDVVAKMRILSEKSSDKTKSSFSFFSRGKGQGASGTPSAAAT